MMMMMIIIIITAVEIDEIRENIRLEIGEATEDYTNEVLLLLFFLSLIYVKKSFKYRSL